MKKLACLLLDEEVRGGALSEENSKRFHVHCKKKRISFCLPVRGTCIQGLLCVGVNCEMLSLLHSAAQNIFHYVLEASLSSGGRKEGMDSERH